MNNKELSNIPGVRELVRDIMNDMYKREELSSMFDLEYCDGCQMFNLDEDMTYHKWDLANSEDKICVQCRGDE